MADHTLTHVVFGFFIGGSVIFFCMYVYCYFSSRHHQRGNAFSCGNQMFSHQEPDGPPMQQHQDLQPGLRSQDINTVTVPIRHASSHKEVRTETTASFASKNSQAPVAIILDNEPPVTSLPQAHLCKTVIVAVKCLESDFYHIDTAPN